MLDYSDFTSSDLSEVYWILRDISYDWLQSLWEYDVIEPMIRRFNAEAVWTELGGPLIPPLSDMIQRIDSDDAKIGDVLPVIRGLCTFLKSVLSDDGSEQYDFDLEETLDKTLNLISYLLILGGDARHFCVEEMKRYDAVQILNKMKRKEAMAVTISDGHALRASNLLTEHFEKDIHEEEAFNMEMAD